LAVVDLVYGKIVHILRPEIAKKNVVGRKKRDSIQAIDPANGLKKRS
jgi:hypothetical protein